MKKLATLLLAAGMVLGSFGGAQAIDWKVKGQWQFEFTYIDGGQFVRSTSRTNHKSRYGAGYTSSNTDNFLALQRVNVVLEAVASENLSGTLQFEIGTWQWGRDQTVGTRTNGGSLGQRAAAVGVRQAYIDWFVPNTELKFRMGLQRLDNPSFTFGPFVFGEDVAGVTASYKFNDNVSVVAFWARPYNDNYGGGAVDNHNEAAQYMDNLDAFGLVIPLSFDGFKITPWGMVAAIGPHSLQGGNGDRRNYVADGMLPRYFQTHNRRATNGALLGGDRNYATGWWAALTGEITAFDPFRFAFEGIYGDVTHPDAGYLNRHGWFLDILAEYKLDWGVPGIYAWWGSGDNGNPRDGSQRLPVIVSETPDNMLSTFGFSGSPSVSGPYDGIFGWSGFTGTWGIGARIRDMSFIEDLKHTLRVNIMGGTNDPSMAKYILGKKAIGPTGTFAGGGQGDFYGSNGTGTKGVYLTRNDYALEINFDTVYKIYENLDLMLELGYIHLWLDQSRAVWGSAGRGVYNANGIRGISTTDAIKAAMYIKYSF